MKKNTFGRQFKRDFNERKALFKGLMTQLVIHERIQTTEEKAKAIKGSVEKLVTRVKRRGAGSEASLLPYLHGQAVQKMIKDIAPRFSTRPGGYTRIIKLGKRFNDNASVVIIEWVEKSSKLKVQNAKLKTKAKKSVGDVSETLEAIKEAKTKAGKSTEVQEAVMVETPKQPKRRILKKETPSASKGLTGIVNKIVKKRGDK